MKFIDKKDEELQSKVDAGHLEIVEKYKRKEIELAKPVKRVAGCKGSRGLATGYNMVEVESLNKSLTPNEGKRSSISGSVVKPEVIAKIKSG